MSNTVSVWGEIKNIPNIEAPQGKEGVGSLLNDLFEYGSTSLDRLAFQKALDDIGANEGAGSGFSLQVLPSEFEHGVELLAENELSPALPETAFKIVQQQLAQTVAGELQSPDFLTGQAVNSALFPKTDPTLRHATPETVKGLTLQDIQGLLPADVPPRSSHHRRYRQCRSGAGEIGYQQIFWRVEKRRSSAGY